MRLKSLEIKGFKSFADKTQVLLDNAVTGIVGPNGCGKSNIVDAIRWVIGEHKIKTLRSDHLDDLVFNGTKNRPAAGLAEVSLTFENTRNLLPTEFSTITITRKFYKSGESEYRLNDVVCRLKDIQNLFIDTGVSSDSYAIIELGMVDDIIKDKDNSRRRMLEQAAGISIYKTRKKEAQRKLETTQLDLDRIEDILFEIGNNMRTLESQAQKAGLYLELKEEYKEISLELARESLQEYNDKYQNISDQLETEEDRRIKITAEIADDEAQIEANKTKLLGEEQDLTQQQKRFNELINRIRLLESEKKLSTQHLQHLEEQEQNLGKIVNSAEEQLEQLKELDGLSQKQIEEERKVIASLKKGIEDLQKNREEKKAAFDKQKNHLQAKREKLQRLREEQFDAEKKSAVADNILDNLKRDCFRIEEERNKRELSLKQLRSEGEILTAQLANKKKMTIDLQKRQEEIRQKISKLQDAVEQMREKELETNRQLDARQNEHDLLKSLVDNLEGYPDSIKFLKKSKEWNSEAPLLSDIFSVPKVYRVAIETVLNQYLNYYVVANREEAMVAVSLLEKTKKGKASFFLLDNLKAKKEAQTDYPKGFQPAINLVDTERKYRTLAEYLLAHVLVAEEESALNRDSLPEGFIYVSKNGRIQRSASTLMGGSVGAFEGNKIGRVRNLAQLKNEIEELTKQGTKISREKAERQSELASCREQLKAIDLDKAREELSRLQSKGLNINSKVEDLINRNEEGGQQLAQLQKQIEEHQERVSGDQNTLLQLNTQLSAFKTGLQKANEAFTEAEQVYNSVDREFNQRQLDLNNQQNTLEKLQQEQGFRENQKNNLKKQIRENQKEFAETSEKISATSGKLNFGNNEMEELLTQKENDSKRLNERDRAYYVARNEVKEHELSISRQRKAKEQVEVLVNQLKEKLNEMKVQVAGLKERLQVEFAVELSEILEQERTTELSLEELNRTSEKLKKRLSNMGEVNPTAIEAYQEIKLRHDFIRDQKKDLENARNTLLNTIEEVEQTANSRFLETFEKVRENFIKVFKTLFTEEDMADLKLMDPENLADTGVEIVAQPKGKRPSTLTQLSGGEKTLTSTAFLFAIYLIKPAPFCILDEVDAPLDDANVGKFTDMIREFSDNSQFIIITHNKQTMASVDVIYGVTMQESGVSKLVPVDFRSLAN